MYVVRIEWLEKFLVHECSTASARAVLADWLALCLFTARRLGQNRETFKNSNVLPFGLEEPERSEVPQLQSAELC